MSEATYLSDDQYKQFITGSPAGIQYRVQDPISHLEYDFDGFGDGHLLWTIADYAHQFDGAGELDGGLTSAYGDTARLQDAVRQGYPIKWCVQREADVAPLRELLRGAGISGIVVEHEPAA